MPEPSLNVSLRKTRFAPSPTGLLHIGHALAAREVFSFLESRGCEALLRIEDIDQTRCRPDYEAAIYEDLRWLGFDWPDPVRRQSDHYTEYTSALVFLQKQGLVYRSFLTRRELNADMEGRSVVISPAGERPYPGPRKPLSHDEEEARIAAGEAFNWRLSLSASRDYLGHRFDALAFEETGECEDVSPGLIKARPDWLGDVILARKDTPTSYHLSVTHDDQLQGISHVIRGRDLYHSTHIHVLLQALMGWETPIYRHHGLILGADKRKFSKSDASKTIRSQREAGVRPEEIFRDWTLA